MWASPSSSGKKLTGYMNGRLMQGAAAPAWNSTPLALWHSSGVPSDPTPVWFPSDHSRPVDPLWSVSSSHPVHPSSVSSNPGLAIQHFPFPPSLPTHLRLSFSFSARTILSLVSFRKAACWPSHRTRCVEDQVQDCQTRDETGRLLQQRHPRKTTPGLAYPK